MEAKKALSELIYVDLSKTYSSDHQSIIIKFNNNQEWEGYFMQFGDSEELHTKYEYRFVKKINKEHLDNDAKSTGYNNPLYSDIVNINEIDSIYLRKNDGTIELVI